MTADGRAKAAIDWLPPAQVALLVGLGYFLVSLANPRNVGQLPISFLLKDRLHLAPAALSAFFLVIGIPAYLKPVAGLLSDALPLGGTRRRGYLLLGSVGGAAAWLLLGVAPRTVPGLELALLLLGSLVLTASAVLGGILIEHGQRLSATGRLTTLRAITEGISSLLGGRLGGWLATRDLLYTGYFGAATLLGLAALAAWCLRHEPRATAGPADLAGGATEKLVVPVREMLQSRPLRTCALIIFLLLVAPGFETIKFYIQTEQLGFTPDGLGKLKLVSGAGGLAGGLLFGRLCTRMPLKAFLGAAIASHILATLGFLLYRTQTAAYVIEALSLATSAFALLGGLDVMARVSPRRSAATSYASLLSVVHLTMALSDYLGALLYERLHVRFAVLIWLNAGTTLLALPLLRLLPDSLVGYRDGEKPS